MIKRFVFIVAFFSLIASVSVVAFGIPTAVAQSADEGLIIECDRAGADGTVSNRCGVEEFVAQFVRLAQWGLTIVVFLAVLMLVYGGFEFITAGGRQSKISSGQNIISGTVIGLMISLSAYVIINFVVGAITDTKTSPNPFTAIATVFGGRTIDNTSITKPFSGIDDHLATPTCRTNWNTTCHSEVYCADEAQIGLTGPVAKIQARLNTLGCGCGVDGCFGKATAQCVRRFQIANDIIPTGTVNAETEAKMALAAPQRCDEAAAAARINTILSVVPATVLPSSSISTEVGCCVVRAQLDGAATPLYCINDQSERACAALGSDYLYVKGQQCAAANETKSLCGFCRSIDSYCFEEVGKYWCDNVVKDPDTGVPYVFEDGVCRGGGICAGECVDALRTLR